MSPGMMSLSTGCAAPHITAIIRVNATYSEDHISAPTLAPYQLWGRAAVLRLLSAITLAPLVLAPASARAAGLFVPSFLPIMPDPVAFPRRRLNQQFAVLLLRSGWVLLAGEAYG
jgi:hypothetical protein